MALKVSVSVSVYDSSAVLWRRWNQNVSDSLTEWVTRSPNELSWTANKNTLFRKVREIEPWSWDLKKMVWYHYKHMKAQKITLSIINVSRMIIKNTKVREERFHFLHFVCNRSVNSPELQIFELMICVVEPAWLRYEIEKRLRAV